MNHTDVQAYYGKTLQSSADLQTDACCTPAAMPDYLKPVLAKIHPEVDAKYYGCGLVAPEALAGCRILDLGSGSGRDVYALSALAGEAGFVDGVDMTPEQLETARAHQAYHAEAYGFARPNTAFHEGLIEHLDRLGLAPASYDVVVSNCVLNLAMDKPAVLRGVFELLKAGGEFYFSDVYADRRVPEALRHDPVLYGECLSGALYWGDFLAMARAAGFTDPRLVEDRPLAVNNPGLAKKLGPIRFWSATYRLVKLDGLDAACEDYGQVAVYKGTLVEAPEAFRLDAGHLFETGRAVPVCRNTARMLAETRLAPHFEVIGAGETHFGLFPGCGQSLPFATAPQEPATGDAPAPKGGGCC